MSLSKVHTQHILGAGAVGHLMAVLQNQAGFNTEIIPRSDYGDIKRITYKANDYMSRQSVCFSGPENNSSINLLWLTVKSYQVEEALTLIRHRLTPDAKIFLMQNGMGNLEAAQRVLVNTIPAEQIYVVINTHGALLEDAEEDVIIHHTGIGKLLFGRNYLHDTKVTTGLAVTDFVSDQLHPAWSTQIETELWAKLGINAVINPLTAIYQCRNGQLLEKTELRNLTEQLIAELITFYQKLGYSELVSSFSDRCHTVIENTARNYSSMMLDEKLGRQTEIESITGYLLSRADRVRLAMKGHRSLYHRFQKN